MNFANNYEIILCCGRHFTDYDYFRSSCAFVISQLDTDKEIEIVSGHCKGCDRFCEKFAQEQGYKLLVFEANWKRFGRCAGAMRNYDMVDFIEQTGGAVVNFVSDRSDASGYNFVTKRKKGIKAIDIDCSPSQKKYPEEKLSVEEYESVIDRAFSSAPMKHFYKKEENRPGLWGIAEITVGSPNLSIYEKYEIIRKLEKYDDTSCGEGLCHIAGDFKTAIDSLSAAPGELLFVYNPYFDEDINDIRAGEAYPFTSVEKALEFIDLDNKYEEVNTKSLTWHIIEKWVPDGSGNLRKKYSYYHIYKTGLCWFTPYEYSKTRRKHRTALDDFDDEYLPVPDRDYSFELVHLNLAVPFRAGDIVRIDCAPFTPPVNALVLYSGEDWDCCGVLALYYKNGEYRAGAVKHCDMWLDLMPGVLVSPLFRLRKFTGRLTGNDAVFEEISKIINGSNAIGDKILELNQSGIIRTPEALLAAVQNIQD